mmetsp:Transcript_2956/g.9999  ORF Transcript_2956/g.9999 Transcript_2956/m.9999 type:complete len:208 (+) Transcript_2956:881-1504(+)|eukprot:scaffold1480_cov123-Isochrysis_galbana.AAC.2
MASQPRGMPSCTTSSTPCLRAMRPMRSTTPDRAARASPSTTICRRPALPLPGALFDRGGARRLLVSAHARRQHTGDAGGGGRSAAATPHAGLLVLRVRRAAGPSLSNVGISSHHRSSRVTGSPATRPLGESCDDRAGDSSPSLNAEPPSLSAEPPSSRRRSASASSAKTTVGVGLAGQSDRRPGGEAGGASFDPPRAKGTPVESGAK